LGGEKLFWDRGGFFQHFFGRWFSDLCSIDVSWCCPLAVALRYTHSIVMVSWNCPKASVHALPQRMQFWALAELQTGGIWAETGRNHFGLLELHREKILEFPPGKI